jgi:hypothetical protein
MQASFGVQEWPEGYSFVQDLEGSDCGQEEAEVEAARLVAFGGERVDPA